MPNIKMGLLGVFSTRILFISSKTSTCNTDYASEYGNYLSATGSVPQITWLGTLVILAFVQQTLSWYLDYFIIYQLLYHKQNILIFTFICFPSINKTIIQVCS